MIEAAVDPANAARNDRVSRLEKAKAFLDLDHRCLQIADLVADSPRVLNVVDADTV